MEGREDGSAPTFFGAGSIGMSPGRSMLASMEFRPDSGTGQAQLEGREMPRTISGRLGFERRSTDIGQQDVEVLRPSLSQGRGGPVLGAPRVSALSALFRDRADDEEDAYQAPEAPGRADDDTLEPLLLEGGLTGAASQGQQPLPGVAPRSTGDAERVGSTQPVTRSAVIGCINAVVAIPGMISFAVIIFRHPVFGPYMGQLVNLLFLSAALHQIVFCLRSCMPFAIGQVQDVGLIFLSAMAKSVVELCDHAQCGVNKTIGTVLVAVSISTTLVGLMVIASAKLGIASIIQYVPLPAVGGYLSYVGYFCVAAGVALASGKDIGSMASWVTLADGWAPAVKLLPALVSMVAFKIVATRVHNPLALPALLIVLPAMMYAYLFATGLSLADAQAAGWVPQPQPHHPRAFWHIYDLYNFNQVGLAGIYWPALLHQVPTLLGLFVVVAFGSTMDIAAIQADLPYDIDFNRELVVVGLSNTLTGVLGAGFTGSYIFSQTIFSKRMGVASPVNGWIVAVSELLIFLLPVSLLDYMPNYFFGALMLWFGFDILEDWLYHSWARLTVTEYGLIWATFAAIMLLAEVLPLEGLQLGILLGVALCAMHFTITYADTQVKAFTVVPSRSASMRQFEQRMVLDLLAGNIMAATLNGFLFFGSSVQISNRLKSIAKVMLETTTLHPAGNDGGALHMAASATGERTPQGPLPPLVMEGSPFAETDTAVLNAPAVAVESSVELAPSFSMLKGSMQAKAKDVAAAAPKFLVLDFRNVLGMDTTAAKTLSNLAVVLRNMGVTLMFTHLPLGRPTVRKLLEAYQVVGAMDAEARAEAEAGKTCKSFASMDHGLMYCEERLIDFAIQRGLCAPRTTTMSLEAVLRSACSSFLQEPPTMAATWHRSAALLAKYTISRTLTGGDTLFREGEPSSGFFFILQGTICCTINWLLMNRRERFVSSALSNDVRAQASTRDIVIDVGGIVGDMDFFLQRRRSFTAVCGAGLAVVAEVSQAAWDRMAVEQPKLMNLLQAGIIRQALQTTTQSMEVLERCSALAS